MNKYYTGVCEICNIAIYDKLYATQTYFCIGCNTNKRGTHHKLCVTNGRCKNCRECTLDKDKMYVKHFHIVKYILKNYVDSNEERTNLINQAYSTSQSFIKNDINIYMGNARLPHDINPNLQELIDLLLNNFQLEYNNIVEMIKDEWHQSRTSGLLTKCAK